ncbi:hypothetical protein [Bacillus pseudomycoides]|uniref:hypothetical protein n=1 Tax=Bacillus pseudomycoides TaxID=64104 RepID=UPI0020D26C17|nr:hypothetical protein [Bacillus pseudomycoides]
MKILENIKKWDYPPNEGLYKNPKYYDQKTGEIHWPPNDGFVSGTQKVETLHPEMRLGRYGNSAGFSLAPERDSFPSRVWLRIVNKRLIMFMRLLMILK